MKAKERASKPCKVRGCERPKWARDMCKVCYGRELYHDRLEPYGYEWSVKHERCIECGETKHKHIAHGLCQPCYNLAYYRSKPEELRAGRRDHQRRKNGWTESEIKAGKRRTLKPVRKSKKREAFISSIRQRKDMQEVE